jgi:hypothetical protein
MAIATIKIIGANTIAPRIAAAQSNMRCVRWSIPIVPSASSWPRQKQPTQPYQTWLLVSRRLPGRQFTLAQFGIAPRSLALTSMRLRPRRRAVSSSYLPSVSCPVIA